MHALWEYCAVELGFKGNLVTDSTTFFGIITYFKTDEKVTTTKEREVETTIKS